MEFEQAESEQQAVRRETILPVDRDRAWAALCDADGLATWLADEVDLDVQEGAEGRMRWRSGEERTVVVEEVLERRRIALRWHEAGGEESLVELTLDDVAEGTRLIVVEMPVLTLRAVSGMLIEGAQGTSGAQGTQAVYGAQGRPGAGAHGPQGVYGAQNVHGAAGSMMLVAAG